MQCDANKKELGAFQKFFLKKVLKNREPSRKPVKNFIPPPSEIVKKCDSPRDPLPPAYVFDSSLIKILYMTSH